MQFDKIPREEFDRRLAQFVERMRQMKTLTTCVTILLVCSSCAINSGLARGGPLPQATVTNTSGNSSAETGRILDLINRCPNWTDEDPANKVTSRRILYCMKQISSEPTPLIRAAEIAYMRVPTTSDSTYRGAKMYLLHRYLFRVPDKWRSSEMHYGGYIVWPVAKGKVSDLWPLAIGRNGAFSVTGRYGGYLGAEYAFLEEFDHLNALYGRRKRT